MNLTKFNQIYKLLLQKLNGYTMFINYKTQHF